MEYVDGGELFGYIAKKRRLDDNDASHLFAQIINGLEHIHKNNIVHRYDSFNERDLKPENLLLTKNKTLKIIDFGLSNNYLPNQMLKTPCGSPSYASPEMILGKKYSGMMVDIWSSGIILYGMVCGYLPFEVFIIKFKDRDNEKLYRKVLEGNISYPDYISEQSKDLISKMLVVDPKKRIKFEEIKSHQYYKKGLSQIKKEEFDFVDKNSLNEMVIEIMTELGYEREEIMKSINKRHNKLTTTYSLLFNKFRADPSKFNPKSGIQIEEIMKKASMSDLELVEEKLLLSKNIFKANNNKNFVNNNNNYMNRIGKNNIERGRSD